MIEVTVCDSARSDHPRSKLPPGTARMCTSISSLAEMTARTPRILSGASADTEQVNRAGMSPIQLVSHIGPDAVCSRRRRT